LHGLCNAGYNASYDAGYIVNPELSKVLKLEQNPLKV
jgi:hypothetical protein